MHLFLLCVFYAWVLLVGLYGRYFYIVWDQTDVANELKLTKVSNNGWRNCCLALSYNQSSKARRLEESTAVESTEDIHNAALRLRQELTKELMRELPPVAASTGWSANMDRERVYAPPTPHLFCPTFLAVCA